MTQDILKERFRENIVIIINWGELTRPRPLNEY